MFFVVQRILPKGTVNCVINIDYFVHGYTVEIGGGPQYWIKMEDCDLIELTEKSFNKLIKQLGISELGVNGQHSSLPSFG